MQVPDPATLQAAVPAAIWVGAIGAIIGSAIALITAALNNRNLHRLAQENNNRADRLARENNERADRLARESQVTTMKVEDRKVKRDRLEEAHQLLSLAAAEFSLTTSTHTAQARLSVDEWNARYASVAKELRRLRMIADLYVPAIAGTADELASTGNVFWGHQQGLLHQLSLGNPTGAQETYGVSIVQAANTVERLVGSAKMKIAEEAAALAAEASVLPKPEGSAHLLSSSKALRLEKGPDEPR